MSLSHQPYESLEAELHDAFWEAGGSSEEMPLLAALLSTHPGRALEIGCGSGRLLLPLLAQGHEVEGLELSLDMIRLAHQHRLVKLLPRPLMIHHGDMTQWRSHSLFQTILVPAFTIQLAEDPPAVLHHWRSLLARGGMLHLTVMVPWLELLDEQPENQWYPDHHAILPDGRSATLETRHQWDRQRTILTRWHRYSVGRGAQAQHHESIQRLRHFSHEQWQHHLRAAGFEIQQAFGDFDPHRLLPSRGESQEDVLTYQAVAVSRDS